MNGFCSCPIYYMSHATARLLTLLTTRPSTGCIDYKLCYLKPQSFSIIWARRAVNEGSGPGDERSAVQLGRDVWRSRDCGERTRYAALVRCGRGPGGTSCDKENMQNTLIFWRNDLALSFGAHLIICKCIHTALQHF